MTDFERGDRVRAPDPDTGEELRGTFIEVDELDDGIDVPQAGDTRKAGAAWMRLDDGSALRVAYGRLGPA
jgi:hypothetical protein